MLAAIPLLFGVGVLLHHASVVPAALAAGAVLAVLAEWLATRHRTTVRRVWGRRSVRVGTTAGAVLVVAAVAIASPGERFAARSVSAAVGGLATYLVLLGAVTVRDAVD